MPIRPENKDRYPANWPEIRERILERAGHKCEMCSIKNHSIGYRDHKKIFVGLGGSFKEEDIGHEVRPGCKIFKIVLTVAHLNHIPEDCDDINLMALCQLCHNNHDAKNRGKERMKRLYKLRGTKDLFE